MKTGSMIRATLMTGFWVGLESTMSEAELPVKARLRVSQSSGGFIFARSISQALIAGDSPL